MPFPINLLRIDKNGKKVNAFTMKHKRDYRLIWFPAFLNKIVIYTLTMTLFMLLFYFFAGSQQFSDRTVNGIIETALLFSISSFFFSLLAIGGRIIRNRYVSHLKKQRIPFLIIAMIAMAVVALFLSLLIVLQTGYGYKS